MTYTEPKNHHYVPEFMLKPWVINTRVANGKLEGFCWCRRKNDVGVIRIPTRNACSEIGLFDLKSHPMGRNYFEDFVNGRIDKYGSEAWRIIITFGLSYLNKKQARDFGKLIFSLKIRRPDLMFKLKSEIKKHSIDLYNDAEIIEKMKIEKVDLSVKELYRNILGMYLEDNIRNSVSNFLIENPEYRHFFESAKWRIRKVHKCDERFVLSDNPLFAPTNYGSPQATWLLPLTPTVFFYASRSNKVIRELDLMPSHRFVRKMNYKSVQRSDRFIFSTRPSDIGWAKRLLANKHRLK